MKKTKLKQYVIKTFDTTVYCTFFTEAIDNKQALLNLQNNSKDFIKIIKNNKDLEISVKEIK